MDAVSAIAAGIPLTLLLTFSGFAIGAIGGLPLALMRRSHRRLVRFPARMVIDLLRGVPPIVWILFIFYGATIGEAKLTALSAAIVAFGLISCAYMAEIYRGGLSAVHHGQWEAASALGMSRRDQFTRVIGPQVVRQAIPASATYLIGLVKDSSIAYTIGVQEILFNADQQAKSQGDALTPYLIAAVLYIIITIPSAWAARSLDAKLRSKIAR